MVIKFIFLGRTVDVRGYSSEFFNYTPESACAKFHAFICSVTIISIRDWTKWPIHTENDPSYLDHTNKISCVTFQNLKINDACECYLEATSGAEGARVHLKCFVKLLQKCCVQSQIHVALALGVCKY